MPRKILRLPSVLDRTGLSRSTVYLRVTEGRFPRPVSLGARAVGWIETEVEEWISRQIEVSREIGGRRTAGIRCRQDEARARFRICTHSGSDRGAWSDSLLAG